MTHNIQENRQSLHVKFGEVDIREYTMTIGCHPDVSIGPPVALSWDYREAGKQNIDDFEEERIPHRRHKHRLKLNYYERMEIIEGNGVETDEIKQAERQVFIDQTSRSFSTYMCYPIVFVGGLRAQNARRINKHRLRQLEREAKSTGN